MKGDLMSLAHRVTAALIAFVFLFSSLHALGVGQEITEDFHTEDLVRLGMIPQETDAEKNSDVFMVIDAQSGLILREKSMNALMPIGGQAIRAMLVYCLLDQLDMRSTVTVQRELLHGIRDTDRRIGLRKEFEIYVGDLVAFALLEDYLDINRVFFSEMEKLLGAPVGKELQSMAERIGMDHTDFSALTGDPSEVCFTTAEDMMRLYLVMLHDERMQALLDEMVHDNIAAEDDAGQGKYSKAGPLGKTVSSRYSAARPDGADYDIRLHNVLYADITYLGREYGFVATRYKDTGTDLIVLLWGRKIELEAEKGKDKDKSDKDAETELALPEGMVTQIAEMYGRWEVVDLLPYVNAQITKLSVVKSGMTIAGWELAGEYELRGLTMVSESNTGFDYTKLSVVLQPDSNTIVLRDDGSRYMECLVMINNVTVDRIALVVPSKSGGRVEMPKPEQPRVSPAPHGDQNDEVIPEVPTLMSQYGWMIIGGGAFIAALFLILIGVLLRRRIDR